MPRSQPSTVEKLTGDFLKLTQEERLVAMGVFAAITKSLVLVTTHGVKAAATPAAPLAAATKRRPRRRPEPQVAEPAETEQA